MKEVVSNNDEDNLPINQNKVKGKVWGCSENLRGKKYYTIDYVDEEIIANIENVAKTAALKKIENIDTCQFWKIQGGKDYGSMCDKPMIKIIQAYAKSEFKSTTEFFNNQNQKS